MITNAKTLPKRYFGLHMTEGVAEYKEPTINNGQPYRIFIGESTIKNMDATFEGRPVYVLHKDKVDLDNIQTEADGYVVKSFFNKADGKHWAEFIIVSDKGHEAIRNGWKLSNAYLPKTFAGGGLWHGVEFIKEVMDGEYEHLAIVPNPRYEESIILTPEEFKEYNGKKEIELIKLANSKTKEKKGMFSFFKKTKIENSDFEQTSVVLPKSNKEMTISEIINSMDEFQLKAAEEQPLANMDHYVECMGQKMKLNELVEKYTQMHGEKAAEEAKKNEEPKKEEAPAAEKAAEEVKKNDESEDKEVKEKALEIAAHEEKEIKKEEATKNAAHFQKLVNAHGVQETSPRVELSSDMVARGKARYGSN